MALLLASKVTLCYVREMNIFPAKWCFCCDQWKSATAEYFWIITKEPWDYDIRCKECASIMQSSATDRRSTRIWYRRHRQTPEFRHKVRVREATKRVLLRLGIRPPSQCFRCRQGGRIEIHHRTYNLQNLLDIEWLCRKCHKAAHPRWTFLLRTTPLYSFWLSSDWFSGS